MTSKYRKNFFSAFVKVLKLKKSNKRVNKRRLIKKYDLVNADFYLLMCLADFTLNGEDFFCNRNKKEKEVKQIYNAEGAVISDGFGGNWSAFCRDCGNQTMEVVRPGKARCSNCG